MFAATFSFSAEHQPVFLIVLDVEANRVRPTPSDERVSLVPNTNLLKVEDLGAPTIWPRQTVDNTTTGVLHGDIVLAGDITYEVMSISKLHNYARMVQVRQSI
ncbi:hypothetical protein FRC12_017601 [Ceratobasidium sp. 428]|nr:hypothetical protein FRC12_017601 [Ceratobasidium sp. 428]